MSALARWARSHRHRAGLIAAILGAILYGVYPPAAQAFYADGGNVVLLILAATFARGLCMAGYCAATRAPLFQTPEHRKQALLGGAFQACSASSVYLAIAYIPGPLAITIIFMHPIMLLFFMAWRGEIKLGLVNLGTTIAALVGLMLVLDLWHMRSQAQWLGVTVAFIGAVAVTVRLYIYGRETQTRNAMVVGAENFLVAALLTIPAILFQMPHLPGTAAGYAYFFLSCGSIVLATFLMFYAISALGAFQYSLMAKLEPIFTALFSVIVLGEVLSFYQYMGIILVVGSLSAYQVFQKTRRVLPTRAGA